MSDLPRISFKSEPAYRIGPSTNAELMKGTRSRLPLLPGGVSLSLPEPAFPSRPKLYAAPDEAYFPKDGRRHYTLPQIYHAMQGWMFPYFRSRLVPGEFHPLITYLFTEWKCNLDCHYCWAFDNRVEGMTEDVAVRSIDWLHSTTCRVLALMGGEVLLRPEFAHKVIYYAAQKGFWVYLPTNGRLMKPDTVDRLADAGVGSVNLAVDAWDVKAGLPKAMAPIRANFDHLIRKQHKYGYTVFININICRNNLDDVRMLTELAHDCNIATDYHICETPMMEHTEFRHFNDNPVFIRPEDHASIGELIDWLIEKQQSGWHMVNSVQRLAEMKKFINKKLAQWGCRAGQNSMIIRTDGTLAPCFPMYSSNHDWGTVEAPQIEPKQLQEMKRECEPNCFSTLNHILAFCYNDARVIRWLLRQAGHGFQGVTGNME